jgi:hypothetical protein
VPRQCGTGVKPGDHGSNRLPGASGGLPTNMLSATLVPVIEEDVTPISHSADGAPGLGRAWRLRYAEVSLFSEAVGLALAEGPGSSQRLGVKREVWIA